MRNEHPRTKPIPSLRRGSEIDLTSPMPVAPSPSASNQAPALSENAQRIVSVGAVVAKDGPIHRAIAGKEEISKDEKTKRMKLAQSAVHQIKSDLLAPNGPTYQAAVTKAELLRNAGSDALALVEVLMEGEAHLVLTPPEMF